MTLRNGKAEGPDGIPAEAIKVDIETTTSVLHSLFGQNLGERGSTSSVERRDRDQAAQKKETSETATTTEGSCSCQCQTKCSTESYWRG